MNCDTGSTPCAICGESRPERFKIYFDGYLKLYKCLECGFVSQFPGPGSNATLVDYESKYTLEFTKKHEFMYPERRRALLDIADRIAKLKPNARICDVGCGDGHFLQLCAKSGMECFGVEGSRVLAEYAASKTGNQIIQGLYNKDMYPEASFDVISFIQVMEHIPTPVSVMETVKYHLRPGGLVVIEVPSIRSPHFLMYNVTGRKRFVAPPDGVIPTHFGYYTPYTLENLARQSGFETVSLTTGRWQHKYSGYLGLIGKMCDPIFDKLRIGGILLISKSSG